MITKDIGKDNSSWPRRWPRRDEDALRQVRVILKDQLAAYPPLPDVVGDRHLLRYIRGKQYNIEEAAQMISDTLKWRMESGVDDIRHKILYGGLNSPYKFPRGQMLLELVPQIILATDARDFKGRPIALEQYGFDPKKVLSAVSIEQYLEFLIYTLEFRALVMEQLAHEEEQSNLQQWRRRRRQQQQQVTAEAGEEGNEEKDEVGEVAEKKEKKEDLEQRGSISAVQQDQIQEEKLAMGKVEDLINDVPVPAGRTAVSPPTAAALIAIEPTATEPKATALSAKPPTVMGAKGLERQVSMSQRAGSTPNSTKLKEARKVTSTSGGSDHGGGSWGGKKGEEGEEKEEESCYGVFLMNNTIRDLKGVGLGHVTSKGKNMVEAALKIALPHYPEYMGKTHMINVPWVFNTLWYFIKGLLDDFILEKISLCGSKYMDVLLQDMPLSSIPAALGGEYVGYNEEFIFDTSPLGPFHSPGYSYSPTSGCDHKGGGSSILTETSTLVRSNAAVQSGMTSEADSGSGTVQTPHRACEPEIDDENDGAAGAGLGLEKSSSASERDDNSPSAHRMQPAATADADEADAYHDFVNARAGAEDEECDACSDTSRDSVSKYSDHHIYHHRLHRQQQQASQAAVAAIEKEQEQSAHASTMNVSTNTSSMSVSGGASAGGGCGKMGLLPQVWQVVRVRLSLAGEDLPALLVAMGRSCLTDPVCAFLGALAGVLFFLQPDYFAQWLLLPACAFTLLAYLF